MLKKSPMYVLHAFEKNATYSWGKCTTAKSPSWVVLTRTEIQNAHTGVYSLFTFHAKYSEKR